MRILVIEDSDRLRTAIQTGLRHHGFAVDAVGDGTTGLSYAANNPYDVVVLDLMLPGLDGMSVLRALRERGKDVHVLILSAMDTAQDRIDGLKQGADDYLVKPFAFEELVERIRALLRRRYGRKDPRTRLGALELDDAGLVRDQDVVVPLTRKEHALLEYLAARMGETVSRIEIEDALYDEDTLPEGNAVQSLVSRVRAKLKGVDGAPEIDTVRGAGYRMTVAPA